MNLKRLNNIETICCESGLKIQIVKKDKFLKKFAAFAVPFGSSVASFIDENGEKTDIIPGTAHYLEHCVFTRDEEGGLMGRLSALGCSTNAYTSYSHTLYFFSCSSFNSFSTAFRLYLESIAAASLSDERIDAEREIIGAELDMYRDDPSSRIYSSLMSNLYINHAAKYDIGGTRESISRISGCYLEKVRSFFYRPGLMSAVISGDFSPDQINELKGIADVILKTGSGTEGRTLKVTEPKLVLKPELRLELNLNNSNFMTGVKDTIFNSSCISSFDELKRSYSSELFLESIIGESSEAYQRFYEQSLVNDSLSVSYSIDTDFALLIISGEAEDPDGTSDLLLDFLRSCVSGGKTAYNEENAREIFEIQKKAELGHFIRRFDGVDSSGMIVARLALRGLEAEDMLSALEEADFDFGKSCLDFILNDGLKVKVTAYSKDRIGSC